MSRLNRSSSPISGAAVAGGRRRCHWRRRAASRRRIAGDRQHDRRHRRSPGRSRCASRVGNGDPDLRSRERPQRRHAHAAGRLPRFQDDRHAGGERHDPGRHPVHDSTRRSPQQTVAIGRRVETKTVSLTLVHSGTCGGIAAAPAAAPAAPATPSGADRRRHAAAAPAARAGGTPAPAAPPGTGGRRRRGGTGAGGTGGPIGGAGGAVDRRASQPLALLEIHHSDVTCDATDRGAGDNEVFSGRASRPTASCCSAPATTGASASGRSALVDGHTLDGRELTVTGQGYIARSLPTASTWPRVTPGPGDIWTCRPTHDLSASSTADSRESTGGLLPGRQPPGQRRLSDHAAHRLVDGDAHVGRAPCRLTGPPWEVTVSPLGDGDGAPAGGDPERRHLRVCQRAGHGAGQARHAGQHRQHLDRRGSGVLARRQEPGCGGQRGSGWFSLWNARLHEPADADRARHRHRRRRRQLRATSTATAFFPDGKYVAAATGLPSTAASSHLRNRRRSVRSAPRFRRTTFCRWRFAGRRRRRGGEVDCGLVMYCHD